MREPKRDELVLHIEHPGIADPMLSMTEGPRISCSWGANCSRADATALCEAVQTWLSRGGLDKLESKGYDLASIQFSISKVA